MSPGDLPGIGCRVQVVLHRPSHPGNMGAAARAMKAMGLTRLTLVAPRRPPDREARALAAGAGDVLACARLCASLDEALLGTSLAIAFSARSRELSYRPIDVRAACVEASSVARGAQVALVFGNETAGLTNADVLKCHRLAQIPSDPVHGSLNLAAAVQIAAYELRIAAFACSAENPPVEAQAPGLATAGELERLYAHLESSLRETGFLDSGKPKRLMERLRRLFGRAGLEGAEVNILRGMLSAWDERMAGRTVRAGLPPERRPPPQGTKVE
ncbi:MAG: RNA methyltransferase [Burkholderiales bacterium]|nr:RNA methyltransferase [Burkholderiales bacterium]